MMNNRARLEQEDMDHRNWLFKQEANEYLDNEIAWETALTEAVRRELGYHIVDSNNKHIPMTDNKILEIITSLGLSKTIDLSYDSGPYEITTITHDLRKLVHAIEAQTNPSTSNVAPPISKKMYTADDVIKLAEYYFFNDPTPRESTIEQYESRKYMWIEFKQALRGYPNKTRNVENATEENIERHGPYDPPVIAGHKPYG